jgi:hypothetical protein
MHLYILFHLAYTLGPYLVVWALSLLSMDLITHRLTAEYFFMAFGVYLSLVSRGGTLTHSVLYLHKNSFNASPKAISERTSYIPVRLEFHP